MADFRLNMAELVAISNQVNDTTCKLIGAKVAARARGLAASIRDSGDYADSITVTSEPRAGVEDWAHTRVGATVPYAAKVESRHGILAKAAE